MIDIKPKSEVSTWSVTEIPESNARFSVDLVAQLTGMSVYFVHQVVGKRRELSTTDVSRLVEQDMFSETILPRSRIISFLLEHQPHEVPSVSLPERYDLHLGHALDILRGLPSASIGTVVTSTPYWGMRIYDDSREVQWADGEICAFGHEQTPEGFLRHTSEVLLELQRVLKDDGSIWWNIMDTYNTRSPIRGSSVEFLRAIQGKDERKWSEHAYRRYSAGHAYLKDGEQCLIPTRIAERASRMGFYVKSVITWNKAQSMPDPQGSRVSRSAEYVLHLTKTRTPYFDRDFYRGLPVNLGGPNPLESERLSDIWTFSTSSGADGHGAQFPIALPGRCIALSSRDGDVVLDPFSGSANTGVAALQLNRRYIGIDVSPTYDQIARDKLERIPERTTPFKFSGDAKARLFQVT